MKFKITYLLFVFLSIMTGNAQTQFWSDTFEDVGAPSSGTRTPSMTFECGGPPATAYFKRTDLAGIDLFMGPYTNIQGSKFWAGEDIDKGGAGCANNSVSANQQVTWSGINISGKTGLSFKGLFAASPFAWQGIWWHLNQNPSQQDFLAFEYRIDGGPWVTAIAFYSDVPATSTGASPTLRLDTNGDRIGDGASLGLNFTEFSADIIGTGTSLDIRMNCFANAGVSQELAIDNFRLFESPSCVAPIITSNPPNRTICNGGNTTFSITATNATAYQWQVNTGSGFSNISNGGVYSNATTSTLNITGATPSMNGYAYRCVASDGSVNCFTNSNSGTLTVSNMTASTTSSNVSCFGGSNGSASVIVSGGTPPYTYSWIPSAGSSQTATGLAPGIYTVTVTDFNFCQITRNFQISQPLAPVSGTTVVTNIACHGSSTGAINLTPTGGTAPYTFNWGGGITTEDRTGLTAGDYSVTITDANGCQGIVNVTVTQPFAALSGTTVVTNIACHGGSTGAINLTPTGGTAPYTFNWGGGITTEDRTGLTAGDYSVTITDANGCTATINATVTQPSVLTASPQSQVNVGCNETNTGSATVNVSGGTAPYTYSWIPSAGSSQTATGLAPGIYTVTVTDFNFCQTTQQFTITGVNSPSITADDSETICQGESITLTPSTNQSFTTGFINDFAANNWTISSNNSNGSIAFNESNVLMISSDNGSVANGFHQAVITIPYNTTISFNWNYTSDDGSEYDYPELFLNGNIQLFNGFSVSSGQNQSGTQTIELQAGDQFGFRIFSLDNVGGRATVTITNFQVASNQYAWVASNGGVINGASNQLNLEVNTAGTYTLTVTNGNGCTATKSIEVIENQIPLPTVSSETQHFCVTGSVSQLVATGDNLKWYSVATNGVALASDTVLSTGIYYVSQTVNGCESARAAVSVSVNTAPSAPTAESVFYFAQGQTLADINLQGSNLTWYDAAIGGNVLPVSTILANGFTYYISQTVNGCESGRTPIDALESFIASSALRPAFCDTTFPSLNSALFAITISGSSMYEFEVTNTVTNTVELISTTNRFFKISDLAGGGSFNTVYSVRVRVVNGGQTGPFGNACTVSIIPQPIQLRDVSCGINLGSVSSLIYGESFSGAELYEFEITNMTTNQVSSVVSASRNFTLAQMTDQTPTLFTEYQVRMRAWIGGAPVVAFGPVCSVFTPQNLTQLRPGSCDAALPNRFTPIFANSVPNAISYEFEVTDTVTNEVETIVRDVRNFHLGLLEMEIAFNRVYAIRVRVVVDGQQMNYGAVCNVTTPVDTSIISRGAMVVDNSFKTYPNPFNTQTTISWTKSASTQANISVHDVAGKLIQTLTTNESSIQIGQDYTAGMYFVTIVDGEQQFQTKIVKK